MRVEVGEQCEANAAPVVRSPARSPVSTRATPYSMLVLASDEADAVEAAGGLLFDRASAGWIVDVRTALSADETPFRILGVPVSTLGDRLHAMNDWPDALVVSGNLHGTNAAVRELFSAAARRTGTEVAMWGGTWPRDIGRGVVRVEHRLSCAAVAFKAHAMVAAGLPSEAEASEQFRSGSRRFALAAPMTAPA